MTRSALLPDPQQGGASPRVFWAGHADHPELRRLESLCAASRVRDPSQATVVVGVGDPITWPSTAIARNTSAFVWFESPRARGAYDVCLRRLPHARFVHGDAGLARLRAELLRHGVIAEDPALDEAATDVLAAMQAAWLDETEAAFSALSDSRDGLAWREWLVRVVSSAETWGFSSLATSARDLLERGAPLDTGAFADVFVALQQARVEHEDRRPAPPAAFDQGVRQRIVVLTDDDRLARQARLALEHSRLRVVVHADAASLLDVLHTEMPDALVVSQRLEHFDGLDVAAAVRTDDAFRGLPVLALLPDEGECEHALRCGVTTWLAAPFTAETLVLATLNLLRRAEDVRRGGVIDPLTRLLTRDALHQALDTQLAHGRRLGMPSHLVFLHITGGEAANADESPRGALAELATDARLAFGDDARIARFNERTLAIVGAGGPDVLTDHLRQLARERDRAVCYAAALAPPGAAAETVLADALARLSRVLADPEALPVDWSEAPGAVRPPSVFLFDGDPAIGHLVGYFCGREGYDVATATDGRGAMDLLEAAERDGRLPDLVLLEAYLPGTDGFRVLEQIKRRWGNRVAVLMLTVQQSEERVARAFDLGAVDFVTKPFRVPELMARVRNALRRAGALR